MTRSIASLAVAAGASADATPRATLIALGAIGTLLVSRLPEIVLREGFAADGPWLGAIPVAVAVALWLGSRAIAGLLPLSGFFGVMAAVSALIVGIETFFDSAVWAALAPESSGAMVRLLSERLVLGALAVVVAIALARFGGGSVTYLRLRPMGASPSDDADLPAAIRWRRLGPVAVISLIGLTALAMAPLLPETIDIAAAAPFLTMAVLAALMNALWEEVAFRAAPMGALAPVVGAGPAIAILAIWFGLGHYYGGMPSGPVGALLVTAVGLVLGRAMADTRGLGWPWAIHASIDLTIYTVLALVAAVPG